MKHLDHENIKFSIILRTLRGVLGVSQTKFAELLDVPKSTLARAENLKYPLKTDTLMKILKFAEEAGIEIDFLKDEPTFKVSDKFIENEKKHYSKNLGKNRY